MIKLNFFITILLVCFSGTAKSVVVIDEGGGGVLMVNPIQFEELVSNLQTLNELEVRDSRTNKAVVTRYAKKVSDTINLKFPKNVEIVIKPDIEAEADITIMDDRATIEY